MRVFTYHKTVFAVFFCHKGGFFYSFQFAGTSIGI